MKTLDFSSKSVKEALSALASADVGLSAAEAEKRFHEYGPNTIKKTQNLWINILLRQLKSPFLYLLFGAAALSVFFGEVIDCIMIVLFIFINTGSDFTRNTSPNKRSSC